MKKTTYCMIYILLLGYISPLVSCVNLAKRFRSYGISYLNDNDVSKYVTVTINSYAVAPAKQPDKPKNYVYTAYSPQGQAQLIKALAAHITVPDTLLKKLAMPISTNDKEDASEFRIFPNVIRKALIFTVDKRWSSGEETHNNSQIKHEDFDRIGDRIANLELEIDLPANSLIKFNSWDKFDTEWASLNLGTVSSSNTITAGANWGASLSNTNTNLINPTNGSSLVTSSGVADTTHTLSTQTQTSGNNNSNTGVKGFSFTPSINASITDQYQSNLNLTLNRLKFSGTLDTSYVTIRQEGGFGVDLSGNTSVTLDYRFDGPYKNINIIKVKKFEDAGHILAYSSIVKSYTIWSFPDITQSIKSTTKFKYLYRHVENPRQIPEGRQHAEYFYGEFGFHDKQVNDANHQFTKETDLIKPSDFRPKTFRLGIYGNLPNPNVYVNEAGSPLNFETAKEAFAFLKWLKQGPTTTGITIPNGGAANLLVIEAQN
jgi:hypothetical protein